MLHTVLGSDCAKAWALGVKAIRDNHGPISPLVTEITDPCTVEVEWWKSLSPRTISASENTLHAVVEMVGPDELTMPGLSRQQVFQRAWTKFDRCRSRGIRLSNWHDTYFERLTRGEDGSNRIDEVIEKMNTWGGRRVAPYYAHTVSNSTGGIVPIGSPCLQYVQFVQRADSMLDMFALYRNHDFFLKALGNFVGLGRLLSFVARETEQTVGKLTCISVNAYLQQQAKVWLQAQTVLPQ